MINQILSPSFEKMPWKNGKGNTIQICIQPPLSTLEKNDFLYRLSSAPIEQNCEFSLFPGKERILVPIKGAGFKLNSNIYEKFEIAQFPGDDQTKCTLLKDAVLDFGVVYDAAKVVAQVRILRLKGDMSFSLEPDRDYFLTVLDGELSYDGKQLKQLETLHYQQESSCQLSAVKNVVLFFLMLKINS